MRTNGQRPLMAINAMAGAGLDSSQEGRGLD
jgi:hypothetical protein